MEFKILDKKTEERCNCFLISTSIDEYIKNIPSDYNNYKIQRAIVNNSYLDRLVHTVLKKGHIPSITLITDEPIAAIESGNIGNFKILDGLQRSHRLKIIFDTKNLFLEKLDEIDHEISDFKLKRKFQYDLSIIGSSGYIFMAIKKYYDSFGVEELNKCFTENRQWFELWNNLSPDDEVKKMLILNAGHKPVNIKHQLELLFQNLLPIFEHVKRGNISIIREKESSSATFSKHRTVGSYHFSHLISSLISFVEGKPISTNTDFISKLQDDERKLNDISELFSYSFLESFIDSVYKVDVAAQKVFGDIGIQWIGREVSLVSLFAALGANTKNTNDLVDIVNQLSDNFDKLQLTEYEHCRNNVDLAKINIGDINKRSIYNGILDLIASDMQDEINWVQNFSRGTK